MGLLNMKVSYCARQVIDKAYQFQKKVVYLSVDSGLV